jgi:hypothetical protein
VLDIADLLAGVDVVKEGHIGPSPNPEKFAVSFECNDGRHGAHNQARHRDEEEGLH